MLGGGGGGRHSRLPVTQPYTDTDMESCRSCNSYSRLADYLLGFGVYQQGKVARGY
jgi:hypothetical protein